MTQIKGKHKITPPQHKIVSLETGKVVPLGTMLRAVDPVAQPYAWHLDAHNAHPDGTHSVSVSRHHPKFGRVKHVFHPRVFGLVIELDIVWYRDVRHVTHAVMTRGGDWFMAGLIALVPLSFFETFHWGHTIAEFLSFGSGGH